MTKKRDWSKAVRNPFATHARLRHAGAMHDRRDRRGGVGNQEADQEIKQETVDEELVRFAFSQTSYQVVVRVPDEPEPILVSIFMADNQDEAIREAFYSFGVTPENPEGYEVISVSTEDSN